VFQCGEHEGSPGLGGNDDSRMQHQADLRRDEGRDAEKVKAERPRPRGPSSEAPREEVLQGDERKGLPGGCRRAQRQQVLQGDEHEGLPGGCRRAQRQVDLSQGAGAVVSKRRRLVSGSERASEVKRRPAQHPSCEARTCEFVCRPAGCPGETERVSGGRDTDCAEKGESGREGDESNLQAEGRDQAGHPSPVDRGSYRSQGWDPGRLPGGAHGKF
jgi:hypothetical protein